MAIRLRHADEDQHPVHEINVTPFIDVMLVLLVIFMVTAPLSTTNLPVDLPSSQAEPPPQPDTPIVLTVAADHALSIDEQPVTPEGLAGALLRHADNQRDRRIFLRADRHIDYQTLMNVMDRLRAAGFLRVALVSLPADAAPASP